MPLGELFLRLALSFFTLLILARIMGRKELSQMTFFNFVSAIAIGSIGANLAVSANLTIRNGVLALVGWASFTLLMGVIDIKSRQVRKVIEGNPLIVVKNGQIVEKTLRKARLDSDALRAMLRQKNVFSLADVEYAIFETNGKLSVMKKTAQQPVTKQDMQIPAPASQLYTTSTVVISDGKLLEHKLKELNLDAAWLEQQLKQAGIEKVSDVFVAEVQPNGTLFIDHRDHPIH